MNFLTRTRPAPQAEHVHRVLQAFHAYLVTWPDDGAVMANPGGAEVTSLAVARVSHPAAGGLTGLLNWAEAEIARSKVPVVDVLDHWAERGVALPHGYPEPEYGLLFLYGGTGAIAHVDRDELHDANKLDQVLRLAVLRERLALHAHRLN